MKFIFSNYNFWLITSSAVFVHANVFMYIHAMVYCMIHKQTSNKFTYNFLIGISDKVEKG